MTRQAAIKRLLREVKFLGFKNIGELVEDMAVNLNSYPLGAVEAYRVYRENVVDE